MFDLKRENVHVAFIVGGEEKRADITVDGTDFQNKSPVCHSVLVFVSSE